MSNAAMISPEDAALAGEYAMGLLSDEERAAFAARLAAEAVLRAEVEGWHEQLAKLSDGVEAGPPPGAKRRLMRRLFGETRRWAWPAMGGLGLAAGIAGLVLFVQPDPEPLVAELVSSQTDLRLIAVFDGSVLRVDRRAGAAADGRALEMWLIAPSLEAPISLGVLPEAGVARRAVDAPLRALFAGATLAVSDEPSGGSPTGAPTGAVLAAGQVTEL